MTDENQICTKRLGQYGSSCHCTKEPQPLFASKLTKKRFFKFSVNTATLKKVKIQVENLHSVKLKDEKAAKSKKPAAKGRTTVKMDLDKVSRRPFVCLAI